MTDNTVANIWGDIIRTIYRLLDTVVYWLLGLMYQIFFNVASAELFTNETVKNFYGRVQLILGVFMIFKLAVSIVKGIVNPDTFVDKKEGMGNIIYRIMFALVMLTIIAPINIPNARNEYEIQLNNNGLLFGTLYSLQNRILSNNTLGRLILGTNDGNTVQTGGSNKNQTQKLKDSANLFTSTILKGFIRINLKDGATDETKSGNWMCQDLDEDTKKIYTDLHADPELVIGLTSKKCDADDASLVAKVFNSNQRYMFAYRGLISAIVGGVFVYILLNFTIDVAVRAIKLAILRLLAPIPIIAYIDPSGEKQAFSSWTKLLTSTYLDLFLRLAIIYFVIFLVEDITKNGLVINQATGIVGILTYIFIFLGLFIFAKQAPKFIKQVFGMKDDGGKMFGGLGAALGVAGGVGAAAIGSVGAFGAGMRASRMADETRQSFGENVNPNSFLNRGKHLMAGIAGGLGGLGTGMKTAFTAKDHAARTTFEAMQKRNAAALAAGDSGSTLFGRMGAMGHRIATGEAPGAELARKISSMESRRKALDAVKKRMSGEMVKQDWTYGNLGIATDKNGASIGTVNYKSFMAAKNAAASAGLSEVTFKDSSGSDRTISMQEANMQEGFLLKNNEDSYITHAISDSFVADDGRTISGKQDKILVNLIGDATAKGATVSNRSSVTDAIDSLDMQITDAKRSNVINEANDRFAGGKK